MRTRIRLPLEFYEPAKPSIRAERVPFVKWTAPVRALLLTINSPATGKLLCQERKSQGASLVVQWLRVLMSMQGTRVPSPVWEDPKCCRAPEPVRHNYRAHAPWRPCSATTEATRVRNPRTSTKSGPTCPNQRKPVCSSEDPAQPKVSKETKKEAKAPCPLTRDPERGRPHPSP